MTSSLPVSRARHNTPRSESVADSETAVSMRSDTTNPSPLFSGPQTPHTSSTSSSSRLPDTNATRMPPPATYKAPPAHRILMECVELPPPIYFPPPRTRTLSPTASQTTRIRSTSLAASQLDSQVVDSEPVPLLAKKRRQSRKQEYDLAASMNGAFQSNGPYHDHVDILNEETPKSLKTKSKKPSRPPSVPPLPSHSTTASTSKNTAPTPKPVIAIKKPRFPSYEELIASPTLSSTPIPTKRSRAASRRSEEVEIIDVPQPSRKGKEKAHSSSSSISIKPKRKPLPSRKGKERAHSPETIIEITSSEDEDDTLLSHHNTPIVVADSSPSPPDTPAPTDSLPPDNTPVHRINKHKYSINIHSVVSLPPDPFRTSLVLRHCNLKLLQDAQKKKVQKASVRPSDEWIGEKTDFVEMVGQDRDLRDDVLEGKLQYFMGKQLHAIADETSDFEWEENEEGEEDLRYSNSRTSTPLFLPAPHDSPTVSTQQPPSRMTTPPPLTLSPTPPPQTTPRLSPVASGNSSADFSNYLHDWATPASPAAVAETSSFLTPTTSLPYTPYYSAPAHAHSWSSLAGALDETLANSNHMLGDTMPVAIEPSLTVEPSALGMDYLDDSSLFGDGIHDPHGPQDTDAYDAVFGVQEEPERGFDPGFLMDDSDSQRSQSQPAIFHEERRRSANVQDDMSRNTVMINVRGARPRRPSKRKRDALGLDEDGYPIEEPPPPPKKPKLAAISAKTRKKSRSPSRTTTPIETKVATPKPSSPLLPKKTANGRMGWPKYDIGDKYYCHQCRTSSQRLYMECSSCKIRYCVRCITSWYDMTFRHQGNFDEQGLCPRCMGNCRCDQCAKRSGGSYVPLKDADPDRYERVRNGELLAKVLQRLGMVSPAKPEQETEEDDEGPPVTLNDDGEEMGNEWMIDSPTPSVDSEPIGVEHLVAIVYDSRNNLPRVRPSPLPATPSPLSSPPQAKEDSPMSSITSRSSATPSDPSQRRTFIGEPPESWYSHSSINISDPVLDASDVRRRGLGSEMIERRNIVGVEQDFDNLKLVSKPRPPSPVSLDLAYPPSPNTERKEKQAKVKAFADIAFAYTTRPRTASLQI